jgi:hypothetical protein
MENKTEVEHNEHARNVFCVDCFKTALHEAGTLFVCRECGSYAYHLDVVEIPVKQSTQLAR